jgi:hypothetical protein
LEKERWRRNERNFIGEEGKGFEKELGKKTVKRS